MPEKPGIAHSGPRVQNVAVFRCVSIFVLAAVTSAYIGFAQEEHEHAGGKTSSTVPVAMRVDINRASVDELLKVPGVTRTWAQRIVKYRPYRTKLDLLEQGIVPGNVYAKMRDYVVAHKVKDK